jgi:hypothetical protein
MTRPPGDSLQSDPATPRVGAGIDFSDPNSPLARYYLRTSQILAVGFLGALFSFTTTIVPLWHTDVWGHVKYGQWMIANGRIPDRELFCPWWDGRQPFTQFYTLTQAVMSLTYTAGERLAGGDELTRVAGGVDLLRVLHGALTAARFAVLLAAFVIVSRSWRVSLLGLAAVVLLDLSNLAVFRPQTFAELFFALLLLLLSRTPLPRRNLVLIPLLAVVWANSHGSFVVVPVVLGVLLAGRVFEGLSAEPRLWPWRDAQARRLLTAMVLALVAVAVLNPYGPSLYTRTLELTRHPSLVGGVGEWKPLVFEWARGWHWVFMLSLVAIALTQLASEKPLPVGHVGLLLVFGIGAALQTRFVIWWAMIVPWVLVPRWAELAQRWPAAWTPAPSVPSFRKTGIAVLLAWALFMWSALAIWLVDGHPQPLDSSLSSGTPWKLARQLRHPDDPAAEAYPGLTEVLRTNYPNGRFSGTVMATPMQGDYLMWALAPDVPVTYSHIHLFHPDYWAELGVVGSGGVGWWDVLNKYRVNLLVVEAEYSRNLRDQLVKSGEWKILVDESGDAANKPNPLTRHLIAVRVKPI